MTIATLDDYNSAVKQQIYFFQSSTNAGGIAALKSNWASDATSIPPTGALAIGNTANGLVPDNTTTGAVSIPTYSGTGYITGAEGSYFSSTNFGLPQWIVFDRLFHCGSYAFNSGTTNLASQPSFSARVPNSDYTQCSLWCEIATTTTGNTDATVTYTDQSGNAGHTTGAYRIPTSSVAAGVLFKMPLASGDCGIQKIESVTLATATGGTYNFLVMREICRVTPNPLNPSYANLMGIDKMGFQQIYPTSCLMTGQRVQNHSLRSEVILELSSL